MKILITTLITIISFGLLSAQPGSLDSTFHETGKVITSIDFQSLNPVDVRIDNSGKIIVLSDVSRFNQSTIITRYLPNGDLDSTFNNNGILFMDTIYPAGMVLLENGEILITGRILENGNFNIILLKIKIDGELDEKFGINGILKIKDGFPNMDVSNILLLPNGKIIISGNISNDYGYENLYTYLIRLNNDCSLDTSFGIDGVAISKTYYKVNISLLQNDGKIVLSGNYSKDIFIQRFNIDGSIDTSFGMDGLVRTKTAEKIEYISDGILQPDGKIFFAGFTNYMLSDILMLRYNADGTKDTFFGDNGEVSLDVDGKNDFIGTIAIQDDHKIVAAGGINSNGDFTLMKFNTDGSLDDNFGNNGFVTTDFGRFDGCGFIKIQNDKKILLVGVSVSGMDDMDLALARYLSGLEVNTKNIILDQENLSLSPNPVKDKAIFKYTLNQDQEINIDLFDINGKWVQSFKQHEYRKKGSYQETINLDSNVGEGVYFLTINKEVGIKLIIKR